MAAKGLVSRRQELSFRLAFYSIGLAAATILALVDSNYAGEAFALVGGIMGGDALSNGLG